LKASGKEDISGQARKIYQELEQLVAGNPDLEALILISYEGLVMVSTMEIVQTEDVISAMASGINSFIIRFLEELKWDPFSTISISGTKKDIIIKDVRTTGLLVALTKPNVDRSVLNSKLDWAVNRIRIRRKQNK